MLKIRNYCTAVATPRPLLLSDAEQPTPIRNEKSPLYLFLAACCLLSGCYSVQQQAYYVNGHSTDYHPLPQTIDSAHTAVYVQAASLSL